MRGTRLVGLLRPELLAVPALVLLVGSVLVGDDVGPGMKTAMNSVALWWAWTAFVLRRSQRPTDDR